MNAPQAAPGDDSSSKSEWKIRLEMIQQLIQEDPTESIMSISNVFPQALRDSNLLCLNASLQLLERIKNVPELHAWPVFHEIISLLVYPCAVHAKSNIRNASVALILDFERISHDIVMNVVTGTVQSTNPVQAKAALVVLTNIIKQQIEHASSRAKRIDFTDIVFLLIQTLQAKEPEVRKASQEAIAQIMTSDSPETQDLMAVLESELPKAHFQALVSTVAEKSSEATDPNAGATGARGGKKSAPGTKHARQDTRPEHPSMALGQSSSTGGDDTGQPQEHYFPAVEPGWDTVLQSPSSKWEEKCALFRQLYDELANNPQQRIPQTSSWQNLTRVVRHVVDNESNNACCIQAIKLQGLMACVIDTLPPQLAKQFAQSLIGKLREKKPAIVSQCSKTIMSLLINKLTLTEAMTDVLAALNSKSPDQKQEMLLFLKNCFNFQLNYSAAANVFSFIDDTFESISYYFKANGANGHDTKVLQDFAEAFKPRITLTTKALAAICKAATNLVCDASQAIRNACTEMLSACCLFHIQSPQHLQVLSDTLFQSMIGYQKSAPIPTVISELMRFNAAATGGSSTEMQRLKCVVLSIQAAANAGAIPTFDAALAVAATTTPASVTAKNRPRSPGVTPGIRQAPSQPGSSEVAERRSPQAQYSRTRLLATPTRQRMATSTPVPPPSQPPASATHSNTHGGNMRAASNVRSTTPAARTTPVAAKQHSSTPQVTELLLNPLDAISESLILADFLAKPYRLSSLFIDLTNTLLLAGTDSYAKLNIQEFIDGLFVTACELFSNFDISLLNLSVQSINNFLFLIEKFVEGCTIYGFLGRLQSKGAHPNQITDGLTYRIIQSAFIHIFEFSCRYFVLLFSLPFSTTTPFSTGSYMPPKDIFERICRILRDLLIGCFLPAVPSLMTNSIDTIIPVLTRTVLLMPSAHCTSPITAKSPDYSAALGLLHGTIFPLFVQLSYEPRHVFNLISSEVLLLSDPDSLQSPVNVVELANSIASICTAMHDKNVPLFPSVNQSASMMWCLTTTIDLIQTYRTDEMATNSLQSLFRAFLLTLQKDVPFTVLSSQLMHSCPPQLQAEIVSMTPFSDTDTKLVKIITQMSISENDLNNSIEPVITAMKLLINHVRDHRQVLHSSLCRLIVQLVVRILRVHRDRVIGVVQPCVGASLGASLSKSAISALGGNKNDEPQAKMVYRLVRYAAIVLLECVESQGCPKFLTSHDTALILVEVGYFCNKGLIQGLFVDETDELITDVIELYTGMMMSLLSNGNIDVLAEANLSLLLEVYVTLMSFTCDYFVARHGNDAEDMTAEITTTPSLFFRFIPENLAQIGSYLLYLQNNVLAKIFIPITDSLQNQINPEHQEVQNDANIVLSSQLDPVKFLSILASCFNTACDHVLTYFQLEHGTSPDNVFHLINPDTSTVFKNMYNRSYEIYGIDSKDIRLCLRFVKSITETYVKSPVGNSILRKMDVTPPYYEILLSSLKCFGNKYNSTGYSRRAGRSSMSASESASCSEDRSRDNLASASASVSASSTAAMRGTGMSQMHGDGAHQCGPAADSANSAQGYGQNLNHSYMNGSLIGSDAPVAASRHKSKIPGFDGMVSSGKPLKSDGDGKDRLVTAPAGLSRTTKQVSLKGSVALLQTSPKEAVAQIHEYAVRDSGIDTKGATAEDEEEFSVYLETCLGPLLHNTYGVGEAAIMKLFTSLKKYHSSWLTDRGTEHIAKPRQANRTTRVRGAADGSDHSQQAYMEYLSALEAELNKNAK